MPLVANANTMPFTLKRFERLGVGQLYFLEEVVSYCSSSFFTEQFLLFIEPIVFCLVEAVAFDLNQLSVILISKLSQSFLVREAAPVRAKPTNLYMHMCI